MKPILLLLFSISGFALFAQSDYGGLNGTIASQKGEPLAGITITIGDATTVTDDDGSFAFKKIKTGSFVLEAKGVGFTATRQNVAVEGGKTKFINLQLNENATLLNEVTVRAAIARSYSRQNTETGTRYNTPLRDIPQAIQIIPRQILNDQQAYRLSDVYKNIAGVTQQSDYNYLNIRGFLTSSANFMLNGQRSSYFGLGVSPQMPYAERVEVLKGPSSVLYGNGAIGGTINIVTKKPRKESFADASLTIGSFNLVRVQADVSGALNKSKTLSALLNIGAETGGSFYQDFKNKSVTITPVVLWNISAKRELTSTTILQVSRETSSPTGIPVIGNNNLFAVPVGFRYSGSDAKYNSTSIQEQLHLQHRFSGRLTGNVWVSYAGRKTDAIIYQPGGYSPRVDSITRVKVFYEGHLKGYAANAYLSYVAATGKITHTLYLPGAVSTARRLVIFSCY